MTKNEDKLTCRHPPERRVLQKRGEVDSLWFCSDCEESFIEIHAHIKDTEAKTETIDGKG